MTDVKDYCDTTHRRLVALKAGLYDVITKAEEVSDAVHSDTANQLRALVVSVEAGIAELKNQCPSDWSPNKSEIDDKMNVLSSGLKDLADKMGIVVPDSTAWI